MMTMKRMMLGGLAVALAGVGACEETTELESLDDPVFLQAAVVAADATLEDLGILGGPFSFGAPGLHGPNGQGPGMGPGQPGGAHGLGNALSGTRDVVFYDVAGTVQAVYGPLTTERVEASVDVEGDVQRGTWTAAIERTRDLVVTGLAGENTTRTLNGSGTEVVRRSAILSTGETATHDMTGTFTYTDLVVPTPDQEVRYPLSGTITRQMTIVVVNGRNGDVDTTVDMTITFDGDETATGVVNGETFEIDLTAREGGFPLRHGFGRFGG